MCDIWKANHEKKELSIELLEKHIGHFIDLDVKEVVLSGGEALMHSNLWNFCRVLKNHNINIILLSTGLLLEKNTSDIVEHINEVIVSLDGSPLVHDRIRNLPAAFEKMSNGIQSLKDYDTTFNVSGRCVLQRHNYFDFFNIVSAAHDLQLDRISFLAADIDTAAFNRPGGWSAERINEVALTRDEVLEFEQIIHRSFITLQSDYDSGFIAERPRKILKIVDHYKAVNGLIEFTSPLCNAPWVSAVVESDGSVLPCFFHKPYGNIYDGDVSTILNSPQAIQFRRNLNVKDNATCKKCVCSLHRKWHQTS